MRTRLRANTLSALSLVEQVILLLARRGSSLVGLLSRNVRGLARLLARGGGCVGYFFFGFLCAADTCGDIAKIS